MEFRGGLSGSLFSGIRLSSRSDHKEVSLGKKERV
jgi:hypothetical protein